MKNAWHEFINFILQFSLLSLSILFHSLCLCAFPNKPCILLLRTSSSFNCNMQHENRSAFLSPTIELPNEYKFWNFTSRQIFYLSASRRGRRYMDVERTQTIKCYYELIFWLAFSQFVFRGNVKCDEIVRRSGGGGWNSENPQWANKCHLYRKHHDWGNSETHLSQCWTRSGIFEPERGWLVCRVHSITFDASNESSCGILCFACVWQIMFDHKYLLMLLICHFLHILNNLSRYFYGLSSHSATLTMTTTTWENEIFRW